jgi:hypothetical protein
VHEVLGLNAVSSGSVLRARDRACPRKGGETLEANGADGISDIEGKVTRVGASECGQRASFKFNIRDDAVLELGSVPLPVVTSRIDEISRAGAPITLQKSVVSSP